GTPGGRPEGSAPPAEEPVERVRDVARVGRVGVLPAALLAALALALVALTRGAALAGRLALPVGPVVGGARRERHVELDRLPVAHDRQRGRLARGALAHERGERLGAAHGVPVDRDDDVAGADPRLGGGRPLGDLLDLRAAARDAAGARGRAGERHAEE